MKYLLDTNAWVSVFRRKSERLLKRLQSCHQDEIALCSLVLAELWYGALRSGPTNIAVNQALIGELRSHYRSIPFDDSAGQHYADIRAVLTQAGKVIGPNDLIIAAIARANGLTLVTHNLAEFQRVTGLAVDDWQ